jgi:hypothetical protein
MLSTPYSVKLLSSLLRTEAFRNSRNCGKPWSTKVHSFPPRFSGVSWKIAHTVSETQGCASKWIQGLNIHSKNQWIPNWTRKSTHTHTHTQTHKDTQKCYYTVGYLVSKFLNFHLLNYNVEQTRSHWTPGDPGAVHQFPQSECEFLFQGFLWIPKHWIYSMSLK